MTGLIPTCAASASMWCWGMGDGVQGPGQRTRHDYTPRDPSMVTAAQGIWAGGCSETWRQDGHLRAGAEGKSLAVLGARGHNGSKIPERLRSHRATPAAAPRRGGPDLRGRQGLLMGARAQGLSKQSGRLCGFQLRPSSRGGQAPKPQLSGYHGNPGTGCCGGRSPLGWAVLGGGSMEWTTVMPCLGLRGRETAGEARPGRGRGEPCPPCFSFLRVLSVRLLGTRLQGTRELTSFKSSHF